MPSLLALDRAFFIWINNVHTEWLDTVMLLASHVGAVAFIWLAVAAIAAVFPERRPAAWRLVLAVGLTSLVVDGMIKPLIWRDRPFAALAEVRVIDTQPRSSSFPSGHAANAIAGAIAASEVLPGVRFVWWMLGATVAISRAYVGVHFPTDILAGSLVGALCALLVLRHARSPHAPFAIGPPA